MDHRRSEYGRFVCGGKITSLEGVDASEVVVYMQMLDQCMLKSMRETDPVSSLQIFLRELGGSFRADRTYIFERNDRGLWDNTFEWCASGVLPEQANLQEVDGEQLCAEWFSAFARNCGYLIADMSAYRRFNPDAGSFLERQGILRLVVCPLLIEGEMEGFLGIDNPPERYLGICTSLLQLAANYCAILLRHRRNARLIDDYRRDDEVTGAHTTALLVRAVEEAIASARRGSLRLSRALLCFTLPQLTGYRQDHGIEEGAALQDALLSAIRQSAATTQVGRFGGEDLYALCAQEQAQEIATQVHRTISQDFAVEVHVGCYTLCGSESGAAQAAGRAAMAAQEIPQGGGSCFHRFEPSIEERYTRINYIASHFEEAMRREWIQVWYQPVVSTLDHSICSLEALVRWDDPVYGMLAPSAFMPVLEKSHTLFRLDLYVIERICRDMQRRVRAGEELLRIFVHLAERDFPTPGIHERINDILREYDIPHSLLCLEITEQALVENHSTIAGHLLRFHQDGFSVWLDNFGSGLSSLGALQTFSVDGIELDMGLVHSITEMAPVVLSSVVNMAKRLGLLVLAEGVETREQSQFLTSVGCVLQRGMYFCAPAPFEEGISRMREKSYPLQSSADTLLFQEISRVNVLDPDYSCAGRRLRAISPSFPCAILLIRGGQWKILYASDSFVTWARSAGAEEKGAFAGMLREGAFDLGEEAEQFLSQETGPGAQLTCPFAASSPPSALTLQLIARHSDTRAFFLRAHTQKTLVVRERDVQIRMSGSPALPPMPDLSQMPSIPEMSYLWDAVVRRANIALFWKDRERRFLGVNQTFLDYYHFQLSDVLGKTDEEMGWHPDPGPFMTDEERVISDGAVITNAPGECLINGKVRRIIANKAPIYREGRVVGLIGCFIDVTDREEARDRLEEEAGADELTGLRNRHALRRDFADYLGSRIYVMMTDIDHFKAFNDQHGHSFGDVVLQQMARALMNTYGEKYCYRYGGDEFLVICPLMTNDEIRRRYHTLRQSLQGLSLQGISTSISLSCGYVTGVPDSERTIRDMLHEADQNLYRVKKSGRNRLLGSVYQP